MKAQVRGQPDMAVCRLGEQNFPQGFKQSVLDAVPANMRYAASH